MALTAAALWRSLVFGDADQQGTSQCGTVDPDVADAPAEEAAETGGLVFDAVAVDRYAWVEDDADAYLVGGSVCTSIGVADGALAPVRLRATSVWTARQGVTSR